MSAKNDTLAATLQANGYSVTKTRQAVLDAFNSHEPVTMAQLVAAVPEVDRASVYRTVALFEKLGILNRLTTGWKYQLELSDLFDDHHHHVTCGRCHIVVPFYESDILESVIDEVGQSLGFTVNSHSLEIRGLCPSCQSL